MFSAAPSLDHVLSGSCWFYFGGSGLKITFIDLNAQKRDFNSENLKTCSTTNLSVLLEGMNLPQCFAYPAWLPIASAIQVSLTIMCCDDISPARFWFCYLKALPFVFTV